MYYCLILVTLIILIPASGMILWYLTPDVRWLREKNPKETAFMRFREKHRPLEKPKRNWRWVRLSQISPYLIQSVIVSEDFNFLIHKGFNWEEMWKSLIANLKTKKIISGGSSITQQLAKNIFLDPSRSIFRKMKEAIITFKLERELTKWRILELYINVIEWGEGIYGAEEASRYHFDKSAAGLTLSEAIRLASVIPNPRILSPLDKVSKFLNSNSERVLAGILQHGWISRTKYEQASMELYHFRASGGEHQSLIPLPKLDSKLLTAEYWISKLNDPDKIIMTHAEVELFNEHAQLISSGIDIFGLPDVLSGKEVRDKLLEVGGFGPQFFLGGEDRRNPYLYELDLLLDCDEAKVKYDANNNPLTHDFYLGLIENLNLRNIPNKKEINYALTIKSTNVLAWPTGNPIMKKTFDYGFNILHYGTIMMGTPVAILNFSKDAQWAFVRTQYIDGWAKAGDLATTTREAASKFPGSRFLLVISPKITTESGKELQMGSKVALCSGESSGYKVILPSRGHDGKLTFKTDFVSSEGVTEGYLPYTAANVIHQAFRYLGTKYSWGGNSGNSGSKSGLDCSFFLQSIFSVFGIKLPRNSAAQAKVGVLVERVSGKVKSFDKKVGKVTHWEPGLTLLSFPGHIMLYLGKDENRQYAIHAVWRIAEKGNDVIDINRVTVTDLELGQGGAGRSLFQKINSVSIVKLGARGVRSLLRDFYYALQHHPWHPVSLFKYSLIFLALWFIVIFVILYT